jgi:chromosomal replication initiation ATPase DnaA
MSETGNIVDIKAIRDRLWTPVNGRSSSELEITLSTKAQQRQAAIRAQEKKAKEDFERRLKLQVLFERALMRRGRVRARRTQEIAEAMEALESLAPPPPQIITIIAAVEKYYGISHVEMMSRRNSEKVAYARRVAMYLCYVLTKRTYPEIARHFDNRDHTTVLDGVKKMKVLVCERPHLLAEIEDIKQRLVPK